MFEILLTTLVSIVTITFTALTFSYMVKFFRSELLINRLLMISMLSIAFGIFVDNFRIIMFLIVGSIDLTSDIFFFAVKFFLLFVGIAALFRVVFILNRQSGYTLKYALPMRSFLILAIGVFSIYNLFTFESAEVTGFPGFYIFKVDQILFILIMVISVPLILFVTIKLNQALKKIRDKSITKPIIFLGFLFIALILERYYNIGRFFIATSSTILLVEYTLLAFIAIFSLIFFLKYPNTLEMLSTYFCVKSIYLIRKKGGQLLFGHDFKRAEKKALTTENLLLGGFIYAISRGLEITLKLSGDLELIQVEDSYLVFGSGKYMAGLVFATEDLPTTKLKLLLLLQRFEKHYESLLEHWRGEISQFDIDTIHSWVYEIFRPSQRKI